MQSIVKTWLRSCSSQCHTQLVAPAPLYDGLIPYAVHRHIEQERRRHTSINRDLELGAALFLIADRAGISELLSLLMMVAPLSTR